MLLPNGCLCSASHSQGTEPGPATARYSTAQHSMAWHSTAQYGTAQHRTAWHSIAQDGTAQHGTGRHSTARYGMVWHSIAWHSTAQYSTGRTARYAQDGTAPRLLLLWVISLGRTLLSATEGRCFSGRAQWVSFEEERGPPPVAVQGLSLF
uniref:Uncharacterized protein n=1 Tax=Pelusios castaneus TaxID=367368 RepID=A0A8C8VKA6_9SAUR